MADFQEWMQPADRDDDDDTPFGDTAEVGQRDAVLFAVDCGASMFAGGDDAPFARCMQCVQRFYQDKIITSDRDLVGLLLYGTEHRLNTFDFPALYVFHELDLNSAARVQEIATLARAASPGTAVAQDFASMVGHSDRPAKGACPPSSFSEVLWAVLHLFNHLPKKGVAFRRVLLFTDREDPSGQNSTERSKCIARARDLREHGISLDVFAHGAPPPEPTPSPITVTVLSDSSAPYSLDPTTAHQPPLPPTGSGGTAASAASVASVGPAASDGGLRGFDRRRFWNALVAVDGAPQGLSSSGLLGSTGPVLGEVHVCDPRQAFDKLLSEIRVKTYPQRTTATLPLVVGCGDDAPRATAGLHTPIASCPKPRFVWLEATTNALVTTESRLVDPAGAALAADDVLLQTTVGGHPVPFTPDEAKKVRSGSSPHGVRVIAFKPLSSLRHKWTLGRSSFLSADEGRDGAAAVRLFSALHASCTAKGLYALAEVVLRSGAAPRLAALVPATPGNTCPDAMEGTSGFHLVALPYADDYRGLSFEQCTAPDEAAVVRAKKLIRRLSVDYDPLALTNPALQHRYHRLQQVALLDSDTGGPEDVTLPDRAGMAQFKDAFAHFNTAAFNGRDPTALLPATKPTLVPTKAQLNAADIPTAAAGGRLDTLTMPYLKEFLRLHKESVTGKKADLVARVSALCERNAKRAREE